MSRMFRGMTFVGMLGLGMALAGTSLAQDNKCTIATKGDNAVVKACAAGGIKEAKKVMKAMVKSAKAGGVKYDCDDCHKDTEGSYELTDDGKEKFKKMLAVLPKAPASKAPAAAPGAPPAARPKK